MTSAWDAIQAGAGRMVAKDGEHLNEAQAIDRFLATADGRELYKSYIDETEGRGTLADVRDGRDLARDAQRTQELAAGREMLRASGYRLSPSELSQGRRADSAMLKLEKLAEGRVAKSGGRETPEHALSEVLKTAEGKAVYRDYESGLAEAQQRVSGAFGAGDNREAVKKAEQRIDAAARRIRDADPAVSLERAAALAMEREPALYAGYLMASRAGARGGSDGHDVGEQESARTVRKSGARIKLSKEAEQFLDDFQSWLDEPRSSIAKSADDKADDAEQFEAKLRGILKQANRRGYSVSGSVYDPDDEI